ncbi:hypothetical protein ACFOEK_13235 [Litoribrevibacter euphylliae]|uniref:Uncharacterized protein n=1 Tax=Litoribrevibacter euphylliae TaxID=1834034 RepID=A0ABV7HDN2_9GAMM
MAFDYGSIDLGLKNPFKAEGYVTAVRGLIQSGLGIFLLILAAGKVKEDAASGWILMLFGVVTLGLGIKSLSSGIYATLRYFVGRNHPTSLALNYSKSESSTAAEEKPYVAYTAKDLEEMLVGRKNTTFVEPQGFLARLLHSLLPKLLFMPYPIRNMAQRLFGAWISTLVALCAYGLVAFISLAGFAGSVGELIFPVYSAVLMMYMLLTWRAAGKAISRKAETQIESLGSGALVKIISMSLILPVLIGVSASWVINQTRLTPEDISHWLEIIPSFHVGAYLIGILAIAAACSSALLIMLKKRLNAIISKSEVSELRENWQESVHPNEIFINLDNLVMANRRYKEVPNRVYRELDPELNEQVDGKGGFKGEMIQEVQPKVKPLELGALFTKTRFIALLTGNVLFVLASILSVFLAFSLIDVYQQGMTVADSIKNLSIDQIQSTLDVVVVSLHLFVIGVLVKSFAGLLSNTAHLFFAEMQFESMLIYFKCEGTFTESKISTGTGIHDSTRSENVLVRSSITPWVIVSRIVSTTFASTGMRNLEFPRYILEMHKDEQELQEIKQDVIGFLKDRESIAAITSERDLGNASQIHQLNQQTRAIPTEQRLAHDEEAAGFLEKQAEIEAEGADLSTDTDKN